MTYVRVSERASRESRRGGRAVPRVDAADSLLSTSRAVQRQPRGRAAGHQEVSTRVSRDHLIGLLSIRWLWERKPLVSNSPNGIFYTL